MSHQLKSGDLAVIIGCRRDPEDIGKVVELVELLSMGQLSSWQDPVEGHRVENGSDEPVWVVINDEIVSYAGVPGYALVAPRHLMPLRGESSPQRSSARKVAA